MSSVTEGTKVMPCREREREREREDSVPVHRECESRAEQSRAEQSDMRERIERKV